MSVAPCFLWLGLQHRGTYSDRQRRQRIGQSVKASAAAHAPDASYAAVRGPVGRMGTFKDSKGNEVPVGRYFVFVDAVPDGKSESFADGMKARLWSTVFWLLHGARATTAKSAMLLVCRWPLQGKASS